MALDQHIAAGRGGHGHDGVHCGGIFAVAQVNLLVVNMDGVIGVDGDVTLVAQDLQGAGTALCHSPQQNGAAGVTVVQPGDRNAPARSAGGLDQRIR